MLKRTKLFIVYLLRDFQGIICGNLVTSIIKMKELIFFVLYADHEPLRFNDAMIEECWKTVMIEEIRAIKKNDMGPSFSFPRPKIY